MTEARRPPPPFPLAIVTGFLGAGKTTLLNRLLRDPALADSLVLINEFGSVGLDHLLVERVDGDMLVMTSGCVCCTIRGELVATLEDALRRRDNGRMAPFRRVLIETTGLADPAPVLHTIMSHPYLRLRFRLQSVVALVDAAVGMATLDAHVEALRQAAMADCLVLTKTDLVSGSAIAAYMDRFRALNPSASRVIGSGHVTAAHLFSDPPYDPVARGSDAAAWLAAEAFEPGLEHAHHHDVHRHDAHIRSFCLRYPRAVRPAALTHFVELLRSAHGSRLLRFKGLIALSDDLDRPVVAHGVQHVMHPLARLEAWPDDDHTTRMVFILQDLDPAFVEGLWEAAAGEPGVDRADLQIANPLIRPTSGLLE